jgi:hypothetical protein
VTTNLFEVSSVSLVDPIQEKETHCFVGQNPLVRSNGMEAVYDSECAHKCHQTQDGNLQETDKVCVSTRFSSFTPPLLMDTTTSFGTRQHHHSDSV